MKFCVVLPAFLLIYTVSLAQNLSYDSTPVRLSAMEVKKVGDGVRLDWKVVCFLEYARFEIQRSANGRDYTTINRLEADRARCSQPFEFTDRNVTGRAFYRIKVGDLDGKFYHSKVVAVTGREKGFEINSLTPSVTTGIANLSISSSSSGNAEIVIMNFQGTRFKQFSVRLNTGVTEVTIDAGKLAQGNYVLTVTNEFSEIKSTRFTRSW